MQRIRRVPFVLLLACALAAHAQPIPFIDAHVHLNDPALQMELMDAHVVTHAVVFWGGRSDNESVLAAAAAHAPRLIPFASISPERRAYHAAWLANDPALLRQLDEMLASGRYKGIGEINAVHFPAAGFPETDFDPLGPMMTGIAALARKHRVPLMVHVEITRIAAFSALLERFPDVTFLWAHGGYTPLYLARRMLERHPNLVYELSARTWPRHPRSPEYTILRDGSAVWPEWLALIEAMPDRFVVGSDSSLRARESDAARLESVQNLLRQLSPRARDAVARDNLRRLLNL